MKSNLVLQPLKTWRPVFQRNDLRNSRNSKNSRSSTIYENDGIESSSELTTPRNNLIDSFNLYSALDNKEKLDNRALYLPPVKEIFRKYSNADIVSDENIKNDAEIDENGIKKITRFHITDPSIAREKSIIEKSGFYLSNHKLDKKKFQIAYKKRNDLTETATVSDKRDILEAVRSSMPEINSVYKNEKGLESRMNSFYYENLKRINKHPVPFCEYAKEHLTHEKDKRKSDKHNCVFCAAQHTVGSLAPENSFIEDVILKPKTPKTPKLQNTTKLPIIKFNNENQNFLNQKEYNQAISALNPPEKTKKTFFCDVLGEKYCLGCIECHERRFAKVYEKKYMNESDPLLVTMNLLFHQKIN